MYLLKTSASFDSAHFLSGYNGKCANIHGHTWKIEVTACSSSLIENGEKRGMVIDFSDLKSAVRTMAKDFDHTLIYEKGSLKPFCGCMRYEMPARPGYFALIARKRTEK